MLFAKNEDSEACRGYGQLSAASGPQKTLQLSSEGGVAQMNEFEYLQILVTSEVLGTIPVDNRGHLYRKKNVCLSFSGVFFFPNSSMTGGRGR